MNASTPQSPEPVVTASDPVRPNDPIPTPECAPPDILRCAYMEIVVTDLARSRQFYVDVLDLVVTEESEDVVYLRSMEEFIHHNLVLRQGPVAAVAAFSYRVRSPEDLDRAVAFYEELGCRIERRAEGFTKGIGDSVRVEDPWGSPTSSSTRSSTSSASRGATSSTRRGRWCALITSTRSPPMCRARSATWRTSGSG